MRKNIPLSVPNLSGNELKYVEEAIKSEWVSSAGPHINRFEENIAKYVNSKGAVACQNGTSGLHIALMVCGITKEVEVIVPTLTFIATVNPVKYIGAEPIFMDCDDSLTIDVDKLSEFCETKCVFKDGVLINKQTKKSIKAIIVVHIFGNMADMEKIMDLAKKYNLILIEDATEALGTYYTNGKFKGCYAGTIGDIGVYSFNGNKIITTGGGGMIVSNNLHLLEKAKHLTTQAKSDELYYYHDEIGYNYRMTNLQAALGLAQLEQLEKFIEIKHTNYMLYKKLLSESDAFEILDFKDNIRSNYWFYSLHIKTENIKRDEVIEHLKNANIQSRPIWGLIHEQIPYKSSQTFKIEKAKAYNDKVVNLPCSTNLTKEDVVYVVDQLKSM